MHKIIVLKPNEKMEIQEHEDLSLDKLQDIVDGYIEVVPASEDNIIMVLNEEGKLLNLPPNFATQHDVIVGNVIFMKSDGEEMVGLTDNQISFIKNIFSDRI